MILRQIVIVAIAPSRTLYIIICTVYSVHNNMYSVQNEFKQLKSNLILLPQAHRI